MNNRIQLHKTERGFITAVFFFQILLSILLEFVLRIKYLSLYFLVCCCLYYSIENNYILNRGDNNAS